MEAYVEKGRIRLRFPAELENEQFMHTYERLAQDIGSVRLAGGRDSNDRELSCALSWQNFRKLRKHGCALSEDRHTREVVSRLRSTLDVYEEESKRGAHAKHDVELAVPYEFKVKPYRHQPTGFNFLHSMKTPGLFGDVGSGKTFIVATFVDSLKKLGRNVALVVVCPVNLINHVWLVDVAKFTDLTAVSLREPTIPAILAEDFDEKKDPKNFTVQERAACRAQRRLDPAYRKLAKARANKRHAKKIQERFDQPADVYVINPEALRTDIKERRLLKLCRRLREEGKEVVLAIDESSKLKTRTSRTYRSLKRIRALCDRCVIMTGTPSPNGLPDLWAQFDVLDDGMTLQPNFVDYRNETCREIILRGVTWKDKQGKTHNATKWESKPGAAIKVYGLIEPRVIRFRTQDCIDLPPKRFLIRDVEMNEKQAEAYEAMEERLFVELDDSTVTARVAAAKLMKLREITGGFVIDDAGVEHPLGASPKMEELDELLEQSIADRLGDNGPPDKALIWAQYQWECRELTKRYQRKYGALALYGGTSTKGKDDAIRRFKTDPSCRLLVCHPASVGHGLNLTEASFVFYYSLSHNFEEFYQSHARIARPGQTKHMTYYFLVCPGTIDEEMLDALRAKKDLSDVVTDGRIAKDRLLGRRNADIKSSREFADPTWGDVPTPSDQPSAVG